MQRGRRKINQEKEDIIEEIIGEKEKIIQEKEKIIQEKEKIIQKKEDIIQDIIQEKEKIIEEKERKCFLLEQKLSMSKQIIRHDEKSNFILKKMEFVHQHLWKFCPLLLVFPVFFLIGKK